MNGVMYTCMDIYKYKCIPYYESGSTVDLFERNSLDDH